MKKLLSLVTLLLLTMSSYAHVWEIRVNQAQNGTLTWYLQSYHGLGQCGIANSGLRINGVNYPLQSEHAGSITGLSNTVFATTGNYARGSYAIVTTPFLGTTLSVQPYSSNVCWAFLVGGSGNFTPPPPPVCTACPITGWSNTTGTPSNNGTLCNVTDDYLPATITVNHLSCASITSGGQFNVIYDPSGANVSYGPYNFTTGISTNVSINLPYGVSSSTQLSVVSAFPCTVTHGLSVPGGSFNGVAETVPPTITCPAAVTVNADNGSCAATNVNLGTPATADNCGVASVTNNAPSGFQHGNTTVTWTVTDINGNTASCTQQVTVVDNQNPTITCPADVTVNADNGTCAATNVALGAPVTNDNCGVAGVSNNAQASYNVGTTVVTWTVTDVNGNTATCTQNVTVVDNQNPTITCPASVTVNADNGACAATGVSLGTPTTGDNCGVASTTNNAPSSFPVGTTTVTWTVTDVNGNSATCTQDVTVVDNQAPVAFCQNYTLNLSGGTGTVTPQDVDNGSSDNCGIASMSVSPNTFNCSDAGTHTVTLTVTDIHGNSSSCDATVTVQYQPTCTVTTTPSNNTYTGGNPNNIYLGYGPQSATVTCNATGGSGFTYSWSPAANLSCTNCQSPVFTPTAAGNYSYTVTATNSNGCATTCTVSFCVLDVRVPGKKGKSSGKVYLCHVPPGNNSNPQTLSVSVNAVASHLGNHSGDRLGSCDESCGSAAKGGKKAQEPTTEDNFGNTAVEIGQLRVYPNPNNGKFIVELPEEVKGGQATILDMSGRVVRTVDFNTDAKVEINLGDVSNGVYMVQVLNNGNVYRSMVSVKN